MVGELLENENGMGMGMVHYVGKSRLTPAGEYGARIECVGRNRMCWLELR